MKISENGLIMIQGFEAFKPKPYLCPAGVPTIGYGTTVYPSGVKVRISDKPITLEQAQTYLKYDCIGCENQILILIQAALNQNQFDALVSFCYNVGVFGFGASTLRKKINKNAFAPDIRTEFMRWINATDPVSGKKVPLKGLFRRREKEANLYFTPIIS